MKIYKFYSSTCGPCKVMTDNLNKISEIQDIIINVNIEDENVDNLIDKYQIYSIPQIIITDDNDKEISRIKGIQSIDKIKQVIENARQC